MNGLPKRQANYQVLISRPTPAEPEKHEVVAFPAARPMPAAKDTPLRAAQRRLQLIGHMSYQSVTTPAERAEYVAELKLGQEHPEAAISDIAQYALARAEKAFTVMGINLQTEAAGLVHAAHQQQPVRHDQSERNRQAQQQQPQM